MAAIQRDVVAVYYAPTRGRRYLTARAAARAEASARLAEKYPTEHAEYENGMMYYPGFHWSSDESLKQVHKRYMRLLLRALKQEQS